MTDQKLFQLVRTLRENLKLSQPDLAAKMGIGYGTVQGYEGKKAASGGGLARYILLAEECGFEAIAAELRDHLRQEPQTELILRALKEPSPPTLDEITPASLLADAVYRFTMKTKLDHEYAVFDAIVDLLRDRVPEEYRKLLDSVRGRE